MSGPKHIRCKKCLSVDTFTTEKKGAVNYAVCQCGHRQFLSRDLTGYNQMFFGKVHKGKKLRDVPIDYLIFIYENCKIPANLKTYIEQRRERISQAEYLGR